MITSWSSTNTCLPKKQNKYTQSHFYSAMAHLHSDKNAPPPASIQLLRNIILILIQTQRNEGYAQYTVSAL